MIIKLLEAEQLGNNISSMLKDCKGITAYALSKDLRLIQTELKEYGDIKTNLFQKYGESLENGSMRIKEEHMQEYIDEMKKFESETVEINFRTLKEEEIVDSGLTGEQMYLINQIIE